MVEAILAETEEERAAALEPLRDLQKGDFEGLFEAMEGLPVTIRLLDPPLHEFLPNRHEVEQQVERARIEQSDDLDRLEQMLDRVRGLEETNPMLGTRGVRLGMLQPDLYRMQVEAILDAAIAVREKTGDLPPVEIMIPLVAYERELELMRGLIVKAGRERELEAGEDYLIGTMLELPRACLQADVIAEQADFFSFGTNDLTQTALGFSRDDIEGRILARYIELKIFDRSPFETIDSPGVGQLVRMGAWLGKSANPGLKLGICGEHGGDPDSIEFFHHSGLDYVSCSPFRVPVARVAAAQAAHRARLSG
jgi:pyruvate,orthophosphate dikinase